MPKEIDQEHQEEGVDELAKTTSQVEVALEYSDASKAHRTAEV
jgi:hypothetical protein